MKAKTFKLALQILNIVTAGAVLFDDAKTMIRFWLISFLLIFIVPSLFAVLYDIFFVKDEDYDGFVYVNRSGEVDQYRFVLNKEPDELTYGEEFTLIVKNEEEEE